MIEQWRLDADEALIAELTEACAPIYQGEDDAAGAVAGLYVEHAYRDEFSGLLGAGDSYADEFGGLL